MIVRYGNYSNVHEITAERPLRVFELAEDTEISGGNFAWARVVTNGFILTQTGGNRRGMYVDDVNDGATMEIREPFDKATQILAALERGGDDALVAYEAIVDMLQADTAPLMDMAEFIVAYAALATDNLTYSANLLKKLAVAVQGQEWADSKANEEIFLAAQAFIRGKTKDQLMGLDTELVRTVT